MAPAPKSPQASCLACEGTTRKVRERPLIWASVASSSRCPGTCPAPLSAATARRCRRVIGCSHIMVFMAGANTTGRAGSQARQTQVRQLSQSPAANLASVLASRGATRNRSAQRRSSTCTTRSPRSKRRPSARPGHSSSSMTTTSGLRTTRLPSRLAGSKKYRAWSVATILTKCPRSRSAEKMEGVLIAATDPVTPSRMFAMMCLAGNVPESTAVHNGADGRGRDVRGRQVPGQGLLRCGEDGAEPGEKRSGRRRVAQLLEITEKNTPRLRRAVKHQVDPRPRLLVLRPPHLRHLAQSLQRREVRRDEPLANVGEVLRVQPVLLRGELVVLGEPLVEPERHLLDHAVEQGMGELVAEVLAQVIAPEGEHEQLARAARGPWVGDKECSPPRQLRVAELHVPVVLLLVIKQIDLNDRVRCRELEVAEDLVAEFAQLLEQRGVRLERAVAVEDELGDAVGPGLAGHGRGGDGRGRGSVVV